jgi:hypothetical protein
VTLLATLALSAALAAPPATTPATEAAPVAAPAKARSDPWEPLQPLLGEWVAEPSGKPGEPASGTASFAFDLDGQVLVRKNHVHLEPIAGQSTGAVHDDLLVMAREGAGLRATYWDNEGHVIRYAVTAAAGTVTLESEPGPGPRFRLAYQPRPDGRYSVIFSIAPPGGEFRPYQAGTMRRLAI